MFGFFQHESCKFLERKDFFRFSREFSQVIHDHIPTVERLDFIDPALRMPIDLKDSEDNDSSFKVSMKEAVKSGRPVLQHLNLFLPFSMEDGDIIAVAKGLDNYLVRKIGADWLESLLPMLLREFLLVKRSCVDSISGLLSSLHLEEYLDSLSSLQQGKLVLLSVYPKSSSSFQAKKYQHRTMSLLKGFLGDGFPLYYLGQSCFGILCDKEQADSMAELVPMLVNYLKREGCVRVHAATVSYSEAVTDNEDNSVSSEVLMKKGWAALRVASRRGPFAFCNSSALMDLENHPLAPPPIVLKRWLQKEAKKMAQFSLLQFTGREDWLVDKIAEVFGKDYLYTIESNSTFMLSPVVDKEQLVENVRLILDGRRSSTLDKRDINVGISIYAGSGGFKNEQLMNCRKALCHAGFLKSGAIVVCDAVSFNISGDIYYGDGDIVKAVKEYKKGLELDPDEGNLLNSLGVCYAQMNKHKAAMECFQRGCNSRDGRFMAFYNMGLEQQILKDKSGAIESFSLALECPESKSHHQARRDLVFQLAVMCTEVKQYERALGLLGPWYETEPAGKALRYLGEIYAGLGQNRNAVKYLQLAMGYDQYDAEVLSLLGEVYLAENEGDEIALRFCEKAVELSPDAKELRIRLARTQVRCGDMMAAVNTLTPCLRNKNTRLAALALRGKIAESLGQIKAAEKWFGKYEIEKIKWSCNEG